MKMILLLFIVLADLIFAIASELTNPNIVIILADDLGWNDVGFHGSNQIPTPNIDALAYTGVILNNYYVTPICTPSRSALLTGKYPIHTGMQHHVIRAGEPWGLGLDETTLPEYLKEAGYVTRLVGKWHLGHFRQEYLPENRGFDSHYGYWTGHQDYYDHTAVEKSATWGYDMRRGMNVTRSDFGYYTTDLFTKEAVKIITEHDQRSPLFLYLAHLATHSANPYRPLQAPAETVAKFSYIKDKRRRLFAGMLSKLDESVGRVVHALSEAKMLNNTIILFSTDNGGPAAGFNLNAASNWPLRGVKDTLWEGGVRGSAFIWSSILPLSTISNAMIHITDWLPTLLSLTNIKYPPSLDGTNVWPCLLNDRNTLCRKEILLNIDTERNISALRYNNWKYKKGNSGAWNDWYGPSGRDMKYNWTELYNSLAAKALVHIKPIPDKTVIEKIRLDSTVSCNANNRKSKTKNQLISSYRYLFDLKIDPCEKDNVLDKHPDIVEIMEKKLNNYLKTLKPARNKPIDERSNPIYWEYTWTNWMDYV